MFLRRKKSGSGTSGPPRLPSYVRNVNSAQCLFCPYGAGVKVGDRVIAWDEKTVFDRTPRERTVEITAVKAFRTNGRVITLDMVVASDEEVARIAEDSEISAHALLTHHSGKSTYDTENTPVVVYFRTSEA
jgi:predicted metalloprotease with PDZ domain